MQDDLEILDDEQMVTLLRKIQETEVILQTTVWRQTGKTDAMRELVAVYGSMLRLYYGNLKLLATNVIQRAKDSI